MRFVNILVLMSIDKRLYLSIILSGLLSLAVAQPSTEGRRFIAGIVAGVNLSQIDGDDLVGYDQIGLNAGARVATVLSERWQLSLELLFSQQGSRKTRNDPPSAALESIRLNFVEVPLLINFQEWRFHVSAGVSYARLINARVRDILGEDVTDTLAYQDNNFFLLLGATYYFNDRFGLNVGWSRALTNQQGLPNGNRLLGKSILIRGIYAF